MVIKKPLIKIRNYTKSYSHLKVFENFDLDLFDNEILCILGPNGCGKSTLLNSIAGLEKYSGLIEKNSENVAFVGQKVHELVMPWMTIEENVAFPKSSDEVKKDKLIKIMKLTGLYPYVRNYPYELSGGMLQLLLIARAFLNESRIIILDEPFKSLDWQMTAKMRKLILNLFSSYRPLIILVSHNVEEAILMSDRIVVLSDKPTRIKKIFDLSNIHKDTRFNLSKEFFNLQREVMHVFEN